MTSFQDAPDEAIKLTKQKRFVLVHLCPSMRYQVGNRAVQQLAVPAVPGTYRKYRYRHCSLLVS